MTENHAVTAFEVSPRALVAALNKVTPAVAKSSAGTPMLEQVLSCVSEGWLHLLGTDRYRIHYARVEVGPGAPAFDRPLPVSLAKDLRAMGVAKSDMPVTLEGSPSTSLIVRAVDGSQRDYGTVLDPHEYEDATRMGRQVRLMLGEVLNQAASGELEADLPPVSAAFLADAVKAGQGSSRASANPVRIEALPKNRVVVSAPGSEDSYRALIMGQKLAEAEAGALGDEHRALGAALRAEPGAPVKDSAAA